MGERLTKIKCPQCGNAFLLDERDVSQKKFLPFCSERCKLIDLGQWAEEKYRIPSGEEDEIKDEGTEKKES